MPSDLSHFAPYLQTCFALNIVFERFEGFSKSIYQELQLEAKFEENLIPFVLDSADKSTCDKQIQALKKEIDKTFQDHAKFQKNISSIAKVAAGIFAMLCLAILYFSDSFPFSDYGKWLFLLALPFPIYVTFAHVTYWWVKKFIVKGKVKSFVDFYRKYSASEYQISEDILQKTQAFQKNSSQANSGS